MIWGLSFFPAELEPLLSQSEKKKKLDATVI